MIEPLQPLFTRQVSRRTRLALAATALLFTVGCVEYRWYDHSPTGMFSPRECVSVFGREANKPELLRSGVRVTLCQPVRIVEVGIATYNYGSEYRGDIEVVRLDLPTGDLFVWKRTLEEAGTITYTGKRDLWDNIGLGFSDFFHGTWGLIKFLIGLAIVLAILGLFSGRGGGTWSGGGTLSGGGTWKGGGTFEK